jgi:predicted CoA-substrate-specific enzyme activase
MQRCYVGLDVGSTTVKTVVRSEPAGDILFHDYRRHEGQQAVTVLHVLRQAKRDLGIAEQQIILYMTGSGGQYRAQLLGARFVQEVTAFSHAVEILYPNVRSVIELGGQDAKMIVYQESAIPGRRRKIASMNDKCAGGTGVIIEKIAAKLHITSEELCSATYDDALIYPVAGKCGVFAETDIIGLQKQGVPESHLMASLFHAIVLQNLSVLTRGNTLMPDVFLLGGPNTYFPGMQTAWRKGLLNLWKQKEIVLPAGATAETLVTVPPMAEYFAAMGAILFGAAEPEEVQFPGTGLLEQHIRESEALRNSKTGAGGLCSNEAELDEFRRTFAIPTLPTLTRNDSDLEIFIGLDGGSTSTKAVALSTRGDVLGSSYRLSQSDPITDAVAVLKDLSGQPGLTGRPVKVLGMGTTGYSKELLKKVLSADVALVETIAHAKSSLHLFPEVDAIIDVGGQDIKIITLQNGAVKDFKVNTQCSAGNGYFLQSAAESFGIPVDNFAEVAFQAKRIPRFSYGCAVFLQSDIVNFQRQGWRQEEILAGLATVLPRNVFLYVAGVSNVAALGRRFVLQGGTQRNLAVVKAEVDFISRHYHGIGTPEVVVHPHCCEAGAIGAALEAAEQLSRTKKASCFPGFEYLEQLRYSIRRDESTRCHICSNRCLRTLVELRNDANCACDAKHVIISNCDRGEAESSEELREIGKARNALRLSAPNYVQAAAEKVWKPVETVTNHKYAARLSSVTKSKLRLRGQIRIGIPRSLNLYVYAPLFSAYFTGLGIPARNLCYSSYSNPERYQEATGFSAVDPCFPSKVALAHIYELLQRCQKEPLAAIFFPMFDVLLSCLEHCAGANACPSGSATPEAIKAAFCRNVNWFQKAGVKYLNPVLNLSDRDLFKYQMYECWKSLLHLDWEENAHAIDAAFEAYSNYEADLRSQARYTLDELERTGGVGLVLLGRPYHHDPGLNQGILEELNRLGYPIFSQGLLPLDPDLLDRLFGADVNAGLIRSPLDISDVWKNTFSTNSNHKIWTAKFVARHPNLISVELSNFKCGHDAFISRQIERIIAASGKPHFAFRDLDENRPLASIRIRIETMHHFLKHYRK